MKYGCIELKNLFYYTLLYLKKFFFKKVFVYLWKDDCLTPNAFFDAQIFVLDIRVIKNFVCITDILKGIQFLEYKVRF